jgi:hypothetical protein
MKPTEEQQQAIDLFADGGNLAVEAGAGTGKTSTLVMLAQSAPDERGQYVAFNKSIVEETRGKLPTWVAANTAHSLAFRAVGYQFQGRLRDSMRMTSREVGQRLGLKPLDVVDFAGNPKHLSAAFLASVVTKAILGFCQSADEVIGLHHFRYIDGIDKPGEYPVNNYAIRQQLMPFVEAYWQDLHDPLRGWAPFKHEHYLKMWQLDDPVINADYILFDEAQDANPVMAAIVGAQHDSQLVYVGDSQQEIYAWTGAVNALANVDVRHRTFLTQSFRFGQAVADVANEVLGRLDAPLRLRGNPAITSRVGRIERPRAVLARTNAVVMSRLLRAQDDGIRCYVMGGGDDLDRFARAVDDLKTSGHTSHPDLACFSSWEDVQAYAAMDEDGEDLRLMVKLVDEFGTAEIRASVARMTSEASAELIISTAHKAKGREWDTVQIGEDFTAVKTENKPALRLEYVAVTRAKLELDRTALAQHELA